MRWISTLAGVGVLLGGAVAAGVASRSDRATQARESFSRGAVPGRLGSWLNSAMDGPSYRAVAEALDLRPDDALLDVACGWGEFLVTYASEARRVAGVDVTPAKVALARGRLADRIADGTAEVVVADASRLPWPDDSFTAVTCMDAFPFFPDQPAVLGEIFRVLRPGGRTVVSFAAEKLPDGVESRQTRGVTGTYRAISDATARRMVQAAGFERVTVSWASIAGDHQLIGRVLRLLGGDEMDIVIGHKPVGRAVSKYDALTRLLDDQGGPEVHLSFSEIADAVRGGLPASAYRRASWWANEPTGRHVQARAWTAAGWRTSHVDLSRHEVTFTRQT
jgi:ubiquinone/menaquinone biosynthesis C-methylase UbiE